MDRAESMKSILDKCVALQQVWDELIDGNLQAEIKGRIIGVKSQMNTLNYFYGVTILQLVLGHSDDLSNTIQPSSLTFCQGKKFTDLTLQTINSLRSESEFELLWQKAIQQAEVLEKAQPSLPRKLERPAKVRNENKASLYDEVSDVKTFTDVFISSLQIQ